MTIISPLWPGWKDKMINNYILILNGVLLFCIGIIALIVRGMREFDELIAIIFIPLGLIDIIISVYYIIAKK